jgi:hypothetical protein
MQMYKHAYVLGIDGEFVLFLKNNMCHVIYRLPVFSFDDRAAVFSILSEIEQPTLASLFEGRL